MTFQCASCNKTVTEPMVVNGLRLCETCSEELASTKAGASLEGMRQPPLKLLRPVRRDE
jgi:hypothetical protein